MAESLFDIISTTYGTSDDHSLEAGHTTFNYLDRLPTLSLQSLTDEEPEALEYDSQAVLRSLQVLSKRSYKSIDTTDERLSHLYEHVPKASENASEFQKALPGLGSSAAQFAEKYNKLNDNAVLDKRKRTMRLGDNVDRLSDVLELPTLLSSIISASSSAASSQAGSTSSANANYATALDLHAHIRRLQRLYPESTLIRSISTQAESAMKDMTSNLISTLRSQSLKLAGGMRLIGLLRRVAPDLDDQSATSRGWTSNADEGSLGAMFLICRLSNLLITLEALEPLQELANQDFSQTEKARERNAWAAGQQTERYLKRYIEVFREQFFAMISMYKSIFPDALPEPSSEPQKDVRGLQKGFPQANGTATLVDDSLQKIPPALSTFTLYIVEMLMDTLRKYLPNIRDDSSRDSLLTQLLYCSASLGRLGGDFSMMLALLEEDVDESIKEQESAARHAQPEWMTAMKKHRVQAGRLELLANSASKRNGTEIPV